MTTSGGTAARGDGATAAGGAAAPSRLLVGTLIALTMVSGLTDAVSYLGFGHVFTANMTGNVVVLGFAAAGAPGFSATGCLTSIGCFLAGTVAAGRLAGLLRSRRTLLTAAMGAEGAVTGAAAAAVLTATAPSASWLRFTVIALLAFGIGVRNAVVRRLGLPDLTTTVLTMVLTTLGTSSGLAGGRDEHAPRKVAEVVAMLLGAATGAYVFLHLGSPTVLLAGAVLVLAAGLIFWLGRQSRLLDLPPTTHPGAAG
ncbi:MAG: YoaK family protein [Streptosporangiaceae bacterium]